MQTDGCSWGLKQASLCIVFPTVLRKADHKGVWTVASSSCTTLRVGMLLGRRAPSGSRIFTLGGGVNRAPQSLGTGGEVWKRGTIDRDRYFHQCSDTLETSV